MKINSRSAGPALATAALICLSVLPAGAQALVHRYSFNGSAADSVGTASGTVMGGVTFATMPTVNGAAVFAGGMSNANPGYISLPPAAINTLQNGTVELFTTNFTIPNDNYGAAGGFFQALLSIASPLGNTTNYLILSPNRGGTGLGIGERANNAAEQAVVAHDPLPTGYGNHVVALVFSGFSGLGSTGTETIYVDGTAVAQTQTVYSFAQIAAGSGGAPVVGLGGGSPFNDPTFQGSMNEVRIYNGALTPAQLQAEVAAGPATFGYQPALQLAALTVSPVTMTGATIAWGTNNAAGATVNYGTTSAYDRTAAGPSSAFTHSVALSGLLPATTYHYQVVSKDLYGQTQTSADATFTTASATGPRLAVSRASIQKIGGQDVVMVTLGNTGATDATGVRITAASLGGVHPATALPVSVGTIAAMGTASAAVSFPAQPSGRSVLAPITASFSGGTASGAIRLTTP